MAIHDLGSVAVTNGSATVTGSGTNWFGALQVGWMFRGPDGLVYAIDSVVSDSELTLSAPYTGAFGLGETGTAPHIDDLDTTDRPTGFYRYTGGTLGPRPNGVGSGANGGVLVIRANATSFVQFLWRNYDGTTGIYHRKYKDLAWSDWVELYNNTTIVGTVAEASGVPTGAILESGSNANGGYIRHADGTQVCTHRLELPYDTAARRRISSLATS